MKNAIYPLSADPIHNGHINNIKKLLEKDLFDKIFVAIGKNYEKKTEYLFTDKEKLNITQQALKSLKTSRVKVEIFDGLLAHYAKKKNTDVIIRGSRNSMDFEKEQTMAEFNRSYGLNTFIIPAPKNTFNISSTTIKAIVKNGGLVDEFVPANIKQALEEKLLGLTLIGVTGNTGSGKTSLCKKLAIKNKRINYIEVDKVIKNLYKQNQDVKEKVQAAFGSDIYLGKNINRKKLAYIIFNDYAKRMELVDILRTPFKVALEEKIKNLKGIILVDCAYLVEYDLLPVVNYNIILLTCRDETKAKRNKKAVKVIKVQYHDKKLKQEIKKQQQECMAGNLLHIDTEKSINYNDIIKRIKQWRIKLSIKL